MAVKVLQERVPTQGSWRDMNAILRELRILGMNQPGFISGETMLSATNQGTTLVISTWAHINDWKAYENSSQRLAMLEELKPLLAEPPTTEVWIESPVIG